MTSKTTREMLNGFADDVKQAMQVWQVPGCAIGIVQDGRTVFAKGFGRRNIQDKLPVTTDTVFAIGSCTKAFTCTALGILADEGKLDWDKPVRDYMSDFRVFDPVASERMTARDLVTHRSGLPRHDMLWYGSSLSRNEMFARLRHLEPSKDFRAVLQYNNLMYLAAGMLIEHISGATWEDFVQQRILVPLGMTRSNLSVTTSQTLDDFAKPFRTNNDSVIEIPFRNLDAIGPAGAINSSINDMAHWLKLNLNKGKHGATQIISEAMLKDIFAPHMVMAGASVGDPEIGQAAYGLGWMVTSYRGHVMLQHGGGIDGFISLVTLMPNERLGIVALTNLGSSPLTNYVSFNALDRLLKMKPAPWLKRLQDREAKMKAAQTEAKKKKTVQERPSALRALEDYAGEYEHAGYGRVRLVVEAEQLHMHYSSFDVPLTQLKGDAFEGSLELLDLHFKFAFGSDFDGNINAFTLVMDPTIKPIVFLRVADEALRDKVVLEKLVGQYDLAGHTITISLVGEDTLVATMPGQPRYTLVPVGSHRFNLKELASFSVEFTLDEASVAQSITFHQPNGDFDGKRVG